MIGILGVVPDGKCNPLQGWSIVIQCLTFSNCFVRSSTKMYWFGKPDGEISRVANLGSKLRRKVWAGYVVGDSWTLGREITPSLLNEGITAEKGRTPTGIVKGTKRIQRGNCKADVNFLETNEEKIIEIKSFTKEDIISQFKFCQEIGRLRTEKRPLRQMIKMSLVIFVTAVSVTLTSVQCFSVCEGCQGEFSLSFSSFATRIKWYEESEVPRVNVRSKNLSHVFWLQISSSFCYVTQHLSGEHLETKGWLQGRSEVQRCGQGQRWWH